MKTKTVNKLIVAGIFLPMMFVLALTTHGVVQAQYNNCTYHAYRLCVGNNNLYWYDSCGNQQDLYYSCASGQVCNSPSQYGQCATYVQPIQPQNNYVAHYKTACYGNSLYWYDSLGVASGLYKSCADNNGCTLDTCSGDKCLNTLKCDGSTCPTSSSDYNAYCLPVQAGVTTQTGATTQTSTTAQTIPGASSGPATKQTTTTNNVSGETGAPSGSGAVSTNPTPSQAAAASVSSAPTATGFWEF